jgi:predicted MFS family arabinose efflux permease
MATAMAAQLVPADHVGRALTVINSGVAAATVAAVPLGAWLGGVWGWRGVFLLAAGVAVLALIVQAATLPSVAPKQPARCAHSDPSYAPVCIPQVGIPYRAGDRLPVEELAGKVVLDARRVIR